MLDTDTKRRIDTARDILVGKLPDPKSQVEQITIALIYKFMDDMDATSEELGGERTFFDGDFQKYGWARLMRGGLGGHEMLGLYSEAITRMPENPGIPLLFRDIFKNAYLPYRDPETLRAFLKIIDEFEYDHSERLGDAFEYLLSVLGSQGDAGQFRTPRHIIDFIVAIVDPKKDETVLDPACGTAGFLISAYKHILKANADADGNTTLTPDDRERLAANFRGYDISPDMVRLSLVNMYLHGFADPQIHEYDTLASQDRWNEHADVILANPPFMSPRGGIQPHNRFSVQSKRSEVLFVDYIAEHLTPNGRAGIIVPEGVVFQSQAAYRHLRRLLLEESLVAVISLPAGVFNPYSGVKTSILILDRALAKKSTTIGFFTVANDGFSLGAQRRANATNDLPSVREEMADYFGQVGLDPASPHSYKFGSIARKAEIAANADVSLSAGRYRLGLSADRSEWPLMPLREIAGKVTDGSHFSPETVESGYPYVTVKDISHGRVNLAKAKRISERDFRALVTAGCRPRREDILFSKDGTVGKTALVDFEDDFVVLSSLAIVTPNKERVLPKYLCALMSSDRFVAAATEAKTGVAVRRIVLRTLKEIPIPVPPLETQAEVIAEIEGYQRVIDGARAVVENYRPHIPIDSKWPIVELGEVAELIRGLTFAKADQLDAPTDSSLAVATTKAAQHDGIVERDLYHIPRERLTDDRRLLRRGDILISTANSLQILGRTTYVEDLPFPTSFGAFMSVVRPSEKVLGVYLLTCLRTERAVEFYRSYAKTTTNISNLNLSDLARLEIPLPPIRTQEVLAADIEIEQSLVNTNRAIVTRFEKKIQAAIALTWGDGLAQRSDARPHPEAAA